VRLAGRWTLAGWTVDGRDLPWDGALLYTGAGWMAAQLSERDGDNYVAYCGRWELDEASSVVRHHVELASVPAWPGTILERTAHLDGGKLVLTTPVDERGHVHELTWRAA
jgi:hypothetical protein